LRQLTDDFSRFCSETRPNHQVLPGKSAKITSQEINIGAFERYPVSSAFRRAPRLRPHAMLIRSTGSDGAAQLLTD
jgi:hypothetical protein